ncbi:uncharacterized protein N7482_006733 [Penicillium canariense]|uniref:Cell surface protein n=1 Tax=Penicillium canariense TaxID=189055 RepID=A0A9W9HWV9_9EURO|nr:uncharacterized protein N7482_006733 [Penicillium canariense]KAJ5159729.1 hypothetical protein N7482_006733 [Penicillium canariense]
MSNLINKVKDTLGHGHGDHDSSSSHTHQPVTGSSNYDSTKSSNYGPHDSNIANVADPRIDSDRSGHAAHNTTSTGHTSTAPLATGATGATGNTYGSNTYESARSSNHGPHGSNVANAMDPRIDSDRDGRAAYGTHSTSTGATSTGLGAGAGAGAGAAGGAYGSNAYESARSSNHGPHDSNVANVMDPRIDSDRDGRAAHSTSAGSYAPHTSTIGHQGGVGGVSQHASTHSPATGPATSTAGPHENNLANKADPRIDSDLSKEKAGRFDHDVHKASLGGAGVIPISGNAGPTSTKTFGQAQETGAAGAGSSYNTSSSGYNQTTAGPHKSDMANKLDPRVDSDLDGSKTIGSQRF